MFRRNATVSTLGLLAAVGSTFSIATAQVTYTLGAFGTPWTAAGSWSPGGGPPTAADIAILNAGVIPGKGTIYGVGDVATAYNAIFGSIGRGWLDQSAGSLTVGNRLTLGQTSGLGEYSMSGHATMTAHEFYVGQAGGGFLTMSDSASVTVDSMVVAAGAASFYEKKVTQTGASFVTVHDALEIGKAGPGSYVLRGGTLSTSRLLIGAPGSTGSGTFRLGPTVGLDSSPLLLVHDDVQVGGGTASGITGTLTNNAGAIVATGPASEIFVHVGKGRLVGTGMWDIAVSYLSTAKVRFAKNSLLTAADMTVTTGLSAGDAGVGPPDDPGEIVSHITPHLLAGSDKSISWSGTVLPGGVDYTTGPGLPTVEVECVRSTATGTGRVDAANVASRVRMLQFGENILASNLHGSATPAGDKFGEIRGIAQVGVADATKVTGSVANVAGGFSVGVLGVAVEPVHQNPLIEALHGPDHDLRGRGVVMGQIEINLPDAAHGCFEDWTVATGRRASALTAGASSAHATLVASLMVGYDPLGIQVNGQSRFEPAANRYGPAGQEGFGFTGVAPDATLVSTDWARFSTSPGADFTALASVAGMKVINQSAGYPTAPQGTNPPSNGAHVEELNIDFHVESKGIVYVAAAGNTGPGATTIWTPSGAYNGICVANAIFESGTPNADYPRIFDGTAASTILNPSSSRGMTADGRAKPDITAQGTDTFAAFTMEGLDSLGNFGADPAYNAAGNRGLYSVRQRLSATTDRGNPGTSYAAPQVAGVTALMVELARDNGVLAAEDPRVIKSVLQTTADKPVGWQKGLAGAGDDTSVPLDYGWGAGVMNPVRAVNLLDTVSITHDAAPITRDGWSLAAISDTDPLTSFGFSGHSYLFEDVLAGSSLTATLNWYRHVDVTLSTVSLLNMNLEIYSWDGTSALLMGAQSSISTIDNVEHIYIPGGLLVGGDYILRTSIMGFGALPGETYALSWDTTFIPTPGAVLLLFALLPTASRRRERGTVRGMD